ncbi:MAG: hypothetical protein ACI8S6_002685, partial [Myxococcota bacterium]
SRNPRPSGRGGCQRPDLLVVDDGWWSNRIAPPGDDTPHTLTRHSWSGALIEEIDAPDSHHVFTALSDGFAWPADEVRELDGQAWTGDVLMVDGSARFSTWDDLDAALLIEASASTLGRRWSHINGLHCDSTRCLLTMGAQDAMIEIDAQSGEPLRWLGSAPPEGLGLEAWVWPASEALVLPHMAQWTADGTLLLTGSSADGAETWATEFALEDGGLAAIWSHGRGEGLGTPALGHAARLDSGDTLVNFGTRGVVQRVSAEGAVLGEVSVGLGRIFGRAVPTEPLPLLSE